MRAQVGSLVGEQILQAMRYGQKKKKYTTIYKSNYSIRQKCIRVIREAEINTMGVLMTEVAFDIIRGLWKTLEGVDI